MSKNRLANGKSTLQGYGHSPSCEKGSLKKSPATTKSKKNFKVGIKVGEYIYATILPIILSDPCPLVRGRGCLWIVPLQPLSLINTFCTSIFHFLLVLSSSLYVTICLILIKIGFLSDKKKIKNGNWSWCCFLFKIMNDY